MKVLAFGEILWDVINDDKHIGGAPLNFAAHYAQCGGTSAIISSLGTDGNGDEALNSVTRSGVNTEFIRRDPEHETGIVMVTLDEGSPSYEIRENVAYDFIEVPDLKALETYDSFYLGTLAQRSPISRRSLYDILENVKFEEIFYDVNLREGCYSKENIQKSLEYCTQFKLNDEEVVTLSELLYGSPMATMIFAEKLFQDYSNLNLIIVTEGARGCFVHRRGELVFSESEKIKVKDTVGAGDSFSASFLYTYQKTGDIQRSANMANKVGGFVASSSGAVPKYSQEILDALP